MNAYCPISLTPTARMYCKSLQNANPYVGMTLRIPGLSSMTDKTGVSEQIYPSSATMICTALRCGSS